LLGSDIIRVDVCPSINNLIQNWTKFCGQHSRNPRSVLTPAFLLLAWGLLSFWAELFFPCWVRPFNCTVRI
jgi:hypothetical protein